MHRSSQQQPPHIGYTSESDSVGVGSGSSVKVRHVLGTAEWGDTRYDLFLLFGFILTVIVVAMILRLALQLTRARLITAAGGQLNRDDFGSEGLSTTASELSLVLRR